MGNSLDVRAPEQHSGTPSRAISTHGGYEARASDGGGCSLQRPTWLGEALALAWRAAGGTALSLVPVATLFASFSRHAFKSHLDARAVLSRARAVGLKRSGFARVGCKRSLARQWLSIARWVLPVESHVSQRWEDAHSDCSRGLVALRLWHGALLGAPRHLRTSGVAAPIVLERLNDSPARRTEEFGCTLDLSRVLPM